MLDVVVIDGELDLLIQEDGEAAMEVQMDGDPGIYMPLYPPAYQGSMEITPSAQTQTIETAGYMMPGDITVNPIPNNYGLITWDGATLTVS